LRGKQPLHALRTTRSHYTHSGTVPGLPKNALCGVLLCGVPPLMLHVSSAAVPTSPSSSSLQQCSSCCPCAAAAAAACLPAVWSTKQGQQQQPAVRLLLPPNGQRPHSKQHMHQLHCSITAGTKGKAAGALAVTHGMTQGTSRPPPSVSSSDMQAPVNVCGDSPNSPQNWPGEATYCCPHCLLTAGCCALTPVHSVLSIPATAPFHQQGTDHIHTPPHDSAPARYRLRALHTGDRPIKAARGTAT
jgi:hypothetical protein